MEKLKMAVVGVGGIAQCHIAGYKNNPLTELYAFCDINEERLRSQGKLHGVERLYTDVNDMLAALPEIDAVSVCTWNVAHAPVSIACLKAGKNVLCEKPMAMTVAEAEAMKKAADESGKLLMIGFVRRFGKDMDAILNFREDGFFGDIYYAKADYLRRNGNPGGWFCDLKRAGGGPMIDLGVHIIDFARYVMGNPKPVSIYAATFKKLDRESLRTAASYTSYGRESKEINDVEDAATALVRFENGAVLNTETSYALNLPEDRTEIALYGTKGGVTLKDDLKFYSTGAGYMTDVTLKYDISLPFEKLFQREIDHYVACLAEGIECRSPAEDGVEIMKILRGAYESAATGHEVLL
ncbi:MAG: Gfo/Idh/MocA family oxidoreductase [Clostridia bacterium]|nr:Gfo/Idh/MocA family oxidoreductase [Clostridia bacterium]MBR5742913.1 Gfo/Idh/MocA family oxidoreductase [Clostridia bacterium]